MQTLEEVLGEDSTPSKFLKETLNLWGDQRVANGGMVERGWRGDTKKREEESDREKTPRRKRPNSGIRLGGVRLLRAKKGKEVLEIVDFRIIEITSEMEVLIRI